MGSSHGQDLAVGKPTPVSSLSAPAILSLIATVGAFIAFVLMLQESLALRSGSDPMSNGLRSVVRRVPRSVYALAVLIGMLLGHLLWP